MTAVGVIGSGAWGTTLALLLANKGLEVTLWEHQPERASATQQNRENTLFLPGFYLPDNLRVTSNIAQATQDKQLLLFVTPSQRMRENARLHGRGLGLQRGSQQPRVGTFALSKRDDLADPRAFCGAV